MGHSIESMKQETLEEAFNIHYKNINYTEDSIYKEAVKRDFIQGAKWFQERSYSEEDMRKAIRKSRDISDGKDCFDAEDIAGCTEVCTYNWKFNMSEDSIIEQFKKK